MWHTKRGDPGQWPGTRLTALRTVVFLSRFFTGQTGKVKGDRGYGGSRASLALFTDDKRIRLALTLKWKKETGGSRGSSRSRERRFRLSNAAAIMRMPIMVSSGEYFFVSPLWRGMQSGYPGRVGQGRERDESMQMSRPSWDAEGARAAPRRILLLALSGCVHRIPKSKGG